MNYETLIENAVQNHMAIYGSSRAEAEAAVNGGNRTSQRGPESVDVSIGPEDIDDYFGQPSIAQYDTDVEDPSSPVVEETSTTKLEDGTTVTQKVSNPNNSPKGIAEKQSAEQSNPQASQAPSDIFDVLGGGPAANVVLNPFAVEPRGPSGRSGYTPSNEIDIGMEPPSIFEVSGGPTGRGGVGGLGEATAMPEANVQVSGMGEGTPVSTVQDAENIINDEAPEIIPWINEFEQAVKEFDENEALVAAERITDKAIETGLDKVKPRAFKALTVALTSMLFGVDAVDAIESGAEVVAQDYAEEAAASAAASAAIADQAKFEREETFKAGLAIEKEKVKAGITSKQDIVKGNYQALKDLATLMQGKFEEVGEPNAMGHLQGAHDAMTAVYGTLDLKDPKIGSAYNQAVTSFLKYKAHQPNGVETLNSFMKDKIARKELSKYKSAISSQDLTSDESYESEDSRKFISKIFSRIKQIAGATNPDTKQPFGEKEAMKKVKAAFNAHMKTQQGSADAKTAKGMGVTPFVWFAANWTG